MPFKSKGKFGILLFAIACHTLVLADVIEVPAGENFHNRLQETLVKAPAGSTILLPHGRFELEDEIVIDQSHITLKGRGMNQTILNFKKQKSGAQGILATGDAFIIEDLAVEDTKGDGIKVAGVSGAVFRRVRMEWTNGPSQKNGGYGLYPVMCDNILIEHSIVRGASDAGVYVGQSHHIVVRNNLVEYNVAGIEIENSRYADVYENTTQFNTAGILVFDLPNLKVQGGRETRVFNNAILSNNGKNFAAKGNIVGVVPPGTGIMLMANDDVEVFGNLIRNNNLVSVAVVNYLVTQNPIRDPNYDPKPERISIHHNMMDKEKHTPFNLNELNIIANVLFGFKVPHIVYDGIEDGTYEGQPLPPEKKICISNNLTLDGKNPSFGNMHLDNQRKLNPFPGGPVTRSLAEHDCAHPALPGIVLAVFPPIPATPAPPTQDEVLRHCKNNSDGVNWQASNYDCPDLQDYHLFQNPSDPTELPMTGGQKYLLSNQLFTDYANKDRFIFLPLGQTINYRQRGHLDFPVGTIITKTFWYARDERLPEAGKNLVETRLLIKRQEGWQSLPYVWNEEGTRATLQLGGGQKIVESINIHGKKSRHDYFIPSYNKCTHCHRGLDTGAAPIGPQSKWLNRDQQLQQWQASGRLQGLPSSDIPSTPMWGQADATLEKRAKAYLDINCAHCHSPMGKAKMSGLFLEYERDWRDVKSGLCKPPVAAGIGSGGRDFDIVPGKPEQSILVYRLDNINPAEMMPEIGRTRIHNDGLMLVSRWIKSMPAQKCAVDKVR